MEAFELVKPKVLIPHLSLSMRTFGQIIVRTKKAIPGRTAWSLTL
jgi:hypothetical protein